MWLIFQASRLPRTLSILLAGSSMSVAGLLMQTMTQNPFAAPSTVGTVEAAQLGLLLSLFVFPQATLAQKMTFSFLTAILLTLLFLKLVKSLPIKEQWVLPLIGVVYSGIIGSLATIVAYRFNLVQSMSSWLQGSFAMIQSNQYEWLFLNLIILVLAWALSSGLTLMGLGEDSSRVLGLSYRRYEVLVIVLVALTTSVTIMTVGSLPFLGVIVPNVVRLYQGDHLKRSVSTIALAGACLVMICDILARVVIAPYEVSVSVILGILGSLGFVMLLWKGRVYE
ncbi:iron complex transport system permease protein [Streptococcus moroccensis]|uniref:Iron complex transport system permease protein n=2 Tax=Streptococcus moroccensis TaxID=1451356 RepID=A0ABT9YSV4_9STRE|nr:iron complex transport system permease protein [Streptococcus moroccensis]